ncbi:hypothetical protein MUG78_17365 [Gordonia alkaliphila]|uniref:hypothetical protein n=1 Tax=Gordonia alkaliphila TaxID=1053547 RepID=UPI001FF116FD|nr:hypothetical protein [Gordonia alkaliphila]MCK0441171.1 hypothetical protein [Gordonia alkaliphila]
MKTRIFLAVSWVVIAGLAVALVIVATRQNDSVRVADPAPPATAGAPKGEQMTLGAVSAAVEALRTASSMTVRGEVQQLAATIDVTYYTDGRWGAGTISAAGADGKVLVRSGQVFVEGPASLWRAMGVDAAQAPGWVRVPDELSGQNIAPSNQRLADALALKESGVVDSAEWDYRTADGTASIGKDSRFTKVVVGGLSARVVLNEPVPAEGTAPGEVRDEIVRGERGQWELRALAAPAPPAP